MVPVEPLIHYGRFAFTASGHFNSTSYFVAQMANSFPRVNRSLGADRGIRWTVVLLIAILLLSAWVGWAFRAKVTRYEVSDSARLELDSTDKLQIIAEFPPGAALGKVRPGQRAILRLDGFPWAQYGTVAAKVSRVAGEIRDGEVKVELAVDPVHPAEIPYQHGLRPVVEVEVERVSPAVLILRSAGELVGAR